MAAALDDLWTWIPPPAPAAMLGCVTEPGSLTDRLIATGRGFAVEPLFLGDSAASADEAAALNQAAESVITARHVALTLDGTTVVVARSLCRRGCPVWLPILDRGGRSLGFTLFSGEVAVRRGVLEYALVETGHPLFDLARRRSAEPSAFPARRCRFTLAEAPLYVCEAFLPALESLLAPTGLRTAQNRIT